MPYTRQQLLAAVRSDHPQLANVEDNKLFAAIAVDHPDLAKGISELQPQSSPETSLGATPLGAMTLGVDPSTFMDRIGGAIASVVNPLLPGGDSRNPNAQLPPMTPNQEIGSRAATIGAAAGPATDAMDSLVAALKSRIPNTASAGAKFQTVMGAAKDIPLDLGSADDTASRALELAGKGTIPGRGSSLPKVLSDYIRQRQIAPTMNYEMGRDFATNAGALSATERLATNPPMERLVGNFAAALKDANREAAVKAGMGEIYDAAMKEYRQAKGIQDAAEIAAKWGKRAVMAAALGGTGAIAGKAAIDAYSALR